MDTQPQATFSFNFDNLDQEAGSPNNPDSLAMTHNGGDNLPSEHLLIKVSGAEAKDSGTSYDAEVALGGNSDEERWSELSSGEVGAGNTITLEGGDFHYNSERLRMVMLMLAVAQKTKRSICLELPFE